MRAWESNIRKVVPYVPGEQPKGDRLIKLNTNENPYPPAPGVAEALKHMDIDRFRKYPDPTASDLVHALAEYYGVGADQVFVGVGSDDVIAMSFLTFFNSKKPVLFPDMSYSFYKVWADLFAIPYETPALDEHFCIRPEDYYRENGGVIFPKFGDPNDARAEETLKKAFPNREIVGIYAREILLGGGNIHCITQQVPQACCR